MNLNHQEAVVLVQKLAWTLTDKKHDYAQVEVVVLPPYTDLRSVQTLVDGDRLLVKYGAQDVSTHDSGAYTGEISAGMLAKLGCSYVVVGHSERREHHGESDEVVNAKAKQALGSKMTPIVCVGEGLEVRQAGDHVAHTVAQVDGSLDGISAQQVAPWWWPTNRSGPSAPARSPPPTTPRRSVPRSANGSARCTATLRPTAYVCCTAVR